MRKIAFEIEIPMVTDKDGSPSTRENIETIFKNLCDTHGYHLMIDPTTQAIVGAKDAPYGNVTPDNSVSTLEVSLDPEKDLHDLNAKWKQCLEEMHAAAPKDVHFLSLSRQPKMPDDLETYHTMVCKKGIYPVILERAWDHRKGLTSASVQPNIDVAPGEAISAIRCINALSGPTVGLFANSPLFSGQPVGLMESRETTWRDFMSTSKVENDRRMIGMLEPVSTWSQYLRRLWDHPIVFFPDMRDGGEGEYKKALCLVPEDRSLTMLEFLRSPQACTFRLFNGSDFDTAIPVAPAGEYVDKGFWWAFWVARLRGSFDPRIDPKEIAEAVYTGDDETTTKLVEKYVKTLYIEVRDIGTTAQPLAGVALILGLLENLKKTEQLVDGRPWSDWEKLREAAIKDGLTAVRKEAADMLAIAREGLVMRGLGEEQYLEPLMQRTASPAVEVLVQFERGGIPEVIARNQL